VHNGAYRHEKNESHRDEDPGSIRAADSAAVGCRPAGRFWRVMEGSTLHKHVHGAYGAHPGRIDGRALETDTDAFAHISAGWERRTMADQR
jgi:hypothetical protein